MKKSVKMIVDYFPYLEKHKEDYSSVMLVSETLDKFNETEQVFLQLIWFFENPEKENFSLELLYNHLSDEWLSLAIESIYTFFHNDTYLLKKPNFSLVNDDSIYFNQSDFAKFLNENKHLHGMNFSRQMVGIYAKRKTIPEPDLVINNINYWLKETCQNYLDQLHAINTKENNNEKMIRGI